MEIEPPEQRRPFVDQACGDDADRRAQICRKPAMNSAPNSHCSNRMPNGIPPPTTMPAADIDVRPPTLNHQGQAPNLRLRERSDIAPPIHLKPLLLQRRKVRPKSNASFS